MSEATVLPTESQPLALVFVTCIKNNTVVDCYFFRVQNNFKKYSLNNQKSTFGKIWSAQTLDFDISLFMLATKIDKKSSQVQMGR